MLARTIQRASRIIQAAGAILAEDERGEQDDAGAHVGEQLEVAA